MLERLLNFQLTIVELACIAVFLGAPYTVAGIVWASTHTAHFEHLQGVRLLAGLLGAVLLWPVIGFTGCA